MEEQKRENNLKKRIDELDNLIDNEKKRLKQFDNMQEEAIALNKNINKCVQLLLKSAKETNKEKMLNDISDRNQSFYNNFTNVIDDEISMAKNNINKMLNEKDKIEKENKDKKE